MKHITYINKLENIVRQHDSEEALTPLIYQLIDNENVSIVVVQTSRKQGYYGISSYPDIVILDKDFVYENSLNNIELKKMYGCVEIKKMSENLISDIEGVLQRIQNPENMGKSNAQVMSGLDIKIKDAGQLLGEIFWYRKVLYTNGIKWMLIECSIAEIREDQYIDFIRKFAINEKENYKSDNDWFGRLARETWIKQISIKSKSIINCEKINDISEEEYQRLIKELRNIKWKK